MTKKIELELCNASKDEGIGSIYERIMVKRYLEKLKDKVDLDSILEFKGIQITKGFDNYIFTEKTKRIDTYLAGNKAPVWPFERKINFANSERDLLPKYDLVWNFATLQVEPDVIDKMKKYSSKYVLVFVPNFWNWGTPFHIVYHWLTFSRCIHAERGKFSLKTRSGVKRYLRKNGLKVIESDYIDMPWIPDIGFSIRELKGKLGIKVPPKEKMDVNPQDILNKIESMKIFEGKRWLGLLKPIVSHHQYILAEVK